jgi:hypothetical protein
MIRLNSEIFVFQNIINPDLISKLIQVRKDSHHTDRVNLHESSMDIFHEFHSFWLEEVEPKLMNEYFSVYDVENDIGFNVSQETISNLKEWIKTKWRDLYLLNYNESSKSRAEKDVHWDFSGITFVGCLSEDYEGGFLCFPRHDITYRLNLGDIIIFPGGITHPHYVTGVTKGHRNVIVGQSLNINGGLYM